MQMKWYSQHKSKQQYDNLSAPYNVTCITQAKYTNAS